MGKKTGPGLQCVRIEINLKCVLIYLHVYVSSKLFKCSRQCVNSHLFQIHSCVYLHVRFSCKNENFIGKHSNFNMFALNTDFGCTFEPPRAEAVLMRTHNLYF